MSMAYIRKTYGVPAKRGMRVMPKIGPAANTVGVIRGATSSGRLRVSDGLRSAQTWWGIYHPNDLTYLPANA